MIKREYPTPPRNVPLSEDEEGRIELEQYTWRDRRAEVNDGQAEHDMGITAAVERFTDSRETTKSGGPPSCRSILVGLIIGTLLAAAYVAGSMPLDPPRAACTP